MGPKTTKTFSDYGADVVKIEGRSRPDNRRITAPFKDGIVGFNRAGRFNQFSTGKMSVALNLTRPKGVEVARRFAAWADVVVENFAAGVMDRIGLGYEELRKVNPDIIMCSCCTMGQKGPYAALPTFGVHLTAMAGFNYIAGWPDRGPVGLEVYTDHIAPHFSAVAILAALDYRRRTGKGQYLDIAAFEGALHFMSPLLLDNAANGRVAEKTGNRCDYAAPHGSYRCCGNDRWGALAVTTDEEWDAFRKVVGEDWAREPKFSTLLGRKANEDELDKLVEGWTVNRTDNEAMTVLQAAGVPAGVVETIEDILDHDPQLKHRQAFWELDHPETGMYRAPAPAFILEKTPCELTRGPLLGEHNEYALKEILGLSDNEVAELIVDGALE